jgi:hypothetical protein
MRDGVRVNSGWIGGDERKARGCVRIRRGEAVGGCIRRRGDEWAHWRAEVACRWGVARRGGCSLVGEAVGRLKWCLHCAAPLSCISRLGDAVKPREGRNRKFVQFWRRRRAGGCNRAIRGPPRSPRMARPHGAVARARCRSCRVLASSRGGELPFLPLFRVARWGLPILPHLTFWREAGEGGLAPTVDGGLPILPFLPRFACEARGALPICRISTVGRREGLPFLPRFACCTGGDAAFVPRVAALFRAGTCRFCRISSIDPLDIGRLPAMRGNEWLAPTLGRGGGGRWDAPLPMRDSSIEHVFIGGKRCAGGRRSFAMIAAGRRTVRRMGRGRPPGRGRPYAVTRSLTSGGSPCYPRLCNEHILARPARRHLRSRA